MCTVQGENSDREEKGKMVVPDVSGDGYRHEPNSEEA